MLNKNVQSKTNGALFVITKQEGDVVTLKNVNNLTTKSVKVTTLKKGYKFVEPKVKHFLVVKNTNVENTLKNFVKTLQVQKVQKVQPTKKTSTQSKKGNIYKQHLLNKLYNKQFEVVYCKDGCISFRYKNVTIVQVKGKTKAKVMFSKKLLSNELNNSLSTFGKNYAHDMYCNLTSVKDLQLCLQCTDYIVNLLNTKQQNKTKKVTT